MFPLNDGPTSKSEAELKCRRWYRIQPTNNVNPMNGNPCPCSLYQAWRDRRFRWDWAYHYNDAPVDVQCYILIPLRRIRKVVTINVPRTNAIINVKAVWSQRCCYSVQFNDYGSLMEGPRYGGHLHLTNNPGINGFLTDEEAHRACCVESNRCELFYKKRPSDNCQGYRPPRQSKCNSLISLVDRDKHQTLFS